jgi:hypothetical protein
MRKRLYVLPLCLLLWACPAQLPPSYSAHAQRANQADAILKAVTVFSQTTINFNAIPFGQPGHITDADTRVVRDFALAIADALQAYTDSGVPTGVVTAVSGFGKALSANAHASPGLKTAWALVQTQITIILPLIVNPLGGQ